MSFPWHRAEWREAAAFLDRWAHDDERILAPDAFRWVVPRISRYVPANLDAAREYDWVVLDRNDLPQIPRAFIEHVDDRMTPVFANARLVVWGAADAGSADEELEQRMKDIREQIAELADDPSEPNRCAVDPALADNPTIVSHAVMSAQELRAAMDEWHARIGYIYPTRRDQTYRDDIEAHIRAFLERCDGRVLDLCTGSMALDGVPEGVWVARTELSEVATRQARDADAGRPGRSYSVMDAEALAFPDRSMDAALCMDSIEHVLDVTRMLREAARVLVDGGALQVSFANRGSVHLRLTAKLGYPEFLTSFHHVREFSLSDVVGLLERAGFEIEETAGVGFYPYWGVPGVDETVRPITDDDPEFVEMMRELGRRAGAEHAYTGVVRARRRVRSSVVLVTPIVPAATGNGLAMRAGMLLDALRHAYAVDLVVVPVAGHRDEATDWAAERARGVAVVDPVTVEQSREHTTRLLADPELRARLAETAPLPELAALVPPTLASDAAAQRGDPDPPDTVLVMRSYLAPFGIELARQLKAARIVVDADDDDAALLHAAGEHDDADAFERLARAWLPDADAVVAASPADAESLAARAGLGSVGVIPNCVQPPGRQPAAPGEERLLFLGNLTYGPNRAAAELLVHEILPAVRQRRTTATLDLVGAHGGALDELAAVDGVRVIGPVGDVAPCYAAADVVVVPLRHGAGTRIKLLEAFAYRRPVVATPVAAAGLDLDGDELVLAESVDEIADAVDRLLADPEGTEAMVDRAARVVEHHYGATAVARLVQATVRAGPVAP